MKQSFDIIETKMFPLWKPTKLAPWRIFINKWRFKLTWYWKLKKRHKDESKASAQRHQEYLDRLKRDGFFGNQIW